MAAPGHFSITSTVRSYPHLPFEKIKNDVLGRAYVLSLVFVGPQRARTINRIHRKKTYVPNVLSFPLAADHGEVFITPRVAAQEARERDMTTNGYIGFLFVHALLHLKGFQHGDTMDRLGKRYSKKYSLS